MSVVKTLALGVSILGSLVAPTLAGSIRASQRIPDRPNRSSLPDAPTSLVVGSPAPIVPPAPAPRVNPSAENLAMLGGFTPTQNWTNTYTSGNRVASSPLSLTAVNQALATYAVATPAPAAAPAAIAVTAPAARSALAAVPALAAIAQPTASVTTAAADAAASTGHTTAAFINFGNGPYSEAQSLTTGTAQSWTQSPAVQSVYRGTPTAAQQSAFMNEVLQVAQNTYAKVGLNVSLTTDPGQNYAHTMSVVSGTSYPGNSQAIGITDVGNDGFSFIDKFNMAKTPDELATAVGHNVAHELMHAFGVAGHPDTTGSYLDAATANWSTLTSADTTFSPQATQMLASQNFLNGPGKEYTQGSLGISGLELLTDHHPVTCHCPFCNQLHQLEAAEGLAVGDPSPVPEPTTVALWGFALGGVAVARRRSQRKAG